MSLSKRYMLSVFFVAILVRIAVMLISESWRFTSESQFGYELGQLARSLATGNGFVRIRSTGQASFAAFPPVYPFILAGFFSIFGIYSHTAAFAVLLFQTLCAGVSSVLLLLIATRLWAPRAGLIAGSIWAFYPTSVFFSVIHVWYSELAVMLLLTGVLIALTTRDPIRFSTVVTFGALTGLLVLTDPTLTIYLALLLLWMVLRRGEQIRRKLMLVFSSALAVGLVVSPWAIRNWVVIGAPVMKSNFGEQLFIGNNPLAVGEVNRKERLQAYTTRDQEELAYHRSQGEIATDRYFRDTAMEWIQNNPLRFAHLTIKRIWYFWAGGLDRKSLLRLTYYTPLLLLGLSGLWLGFRQGNLTPIWLFILVYPLPYYITHAETGRYSYPIEPFVVSLASIQLATWFGRKSVLNFELSKRYAHKANVG